MRTILIVDDSRVIRRAIRRIVESLGFAAEEADDGKTALDYCRAAPPPTAILLDLTMPVMDGIRCLRLLREDDRLRDSVVIVCSTKNSLEEIQEAVASGADEYIMKPFTVEILGDKLRQVGLLE